MNRLMARAGLGLLIVSAASIGGLAGSCSPIHAPASATTDAGPHPGIDSNLLPIDAPPGTPDAPPAPRCGDGHVDTGETCDDGDGKNGTATSLCTLGCVSGKVTATQAHIASFMGNPWRFVAIGHVGGRADGDVVGSSLDRTGISVIYDLVTPGGAMTTFDSASFMVKATSVALADVDGDGLDEIFWVENDSSVMGGPSLYRYDGVANSSKGTAFKDTGYNGQGDGFLFPADVDGDGRIDLIALDRKVGRTDALFLLSLHMGATWSGAGAGTTSTGHRAATLFRGGGSPADHYLWESVDSPLGYLTMQVSRTGNIVGGNETMGGPNAGSSSAGDFIGGDGGQEEVVTIDSGGQIHLLSGTFGPLTDTVFGQADPGATLVVMDVNHDGLADLAVAQPKGQLLVLVNGGAGVALKPQTTDFSLGSATAIGGGFDADGDMTTDLVIAAPNQVVHVNVVLTP